MRVYRTCAPKTANIEHFLDDTDEIQVIQELLPTQSMIDEVFARQPSNSNSRFCPPQFFPIPIYVSESDLTTFYEYCFYLLSQKKFIGNRPVNAALYFLKKAGSPTEKNICKTPPAGVMSKKSYVKAHSFVRRLNPMPDQIKYRSVRDKKKNINYAIFSKKFIRADGVDPTTIIISFVNETTVEVIAGSDTYQISPNF